MRTPRRPPFGPIDAAILSASAILGAAMAGWTDRAFRRRFVDSIIGFDPVRPIPDWLEALQWPVIRINQDIYAFLAIFALGAAVASFRGRAGLRLVGSGPGTVALACVGLVEAFLLAKEFAESLLATGRLPSVAPDARFPLFWFRVLPQVSGTLLGVWAALGVAGRWRPRAGWRDRLGRYLGYGWLSYIVLIIVWRAIWPA